MKLVAMRLLQANNITVVLMSGNVPYSGKVLREKTFMNWWKI